MSTVRTRNATRSDRLLSVLAPYERIVVVMHDNPDPDVIAAGWAIRCLVEERLRRRARVIGGGAIVRAENRHMVELLNPPIELVNHFTADMHTATVLVDCGLGTTNHLVTRAGIEPVAVIDHHQHDKTSRKTSFSDIRTNAAAAASIAASYLREQNIDPGVKLATAILYGIRSETSGSETEHSNLDRTMIHWLSAIADHSLLAEIVNAPLEREYFSDLALAMQSTQLYCGTAICFLPQALGAEIVGEVADLLIRGRGIRSVFCAAVLGDDLVLSARTDRTGSDAAALLRATIGDLGGCGGHMHRAGGKIPDIAAHSQLSSSLIAELRVRWLRANNIKQVRGEPLVARREKPHTD